MKQEKKKQTVALHYDVEKDQAPKIIATGQGITADNMLKVAEESQVPIHFDEKLVKELIQFKVGTEIPPELYEIVSQILIFVEGIDEKLNNAKVMPRIDRYK